MRSGFPGMGGSYHSQSGVAILTNFRVLYMSTSVESSLSVIEQFRNAEIPIKNLLNVRVS